MSPREYAPLLAAALAVLALSAGAATFDAVDCLDGSASADDGGRVDRSESSSDTPGAPTDDGEQQSEPGSVGGDGDGSTDGPGGSGSAPLAVALVLGGLAAAAALLRRLAAGDDAAVDPADDDRPEPAGPSDPAPPTPDPDDGVAAAWLTLARQAVGDDWARRTPGEVTAAARDAGLPADAVADLRVLFERVRYGDSSATPERETRAVAAVERLPDPNDADTDPNAAFDSGRDGGEADA
ncbi:DUF4129 domain-containing protein [Candidatus Halobonum tyrrellensis]|uniref:Protein-glutamine gamma-glutamyltransferase-like C-terminal domain-containing protein n=1 Tax=Candidatus Halobonum tyrrellensis G22 TaxID=1324957 RepID=V4GS41_9EURY|nr:DUF4129 domain-containing protein [Candidatus Halobonum tyrrellensis]ESP87886.1 hypothetical protein K933_11236 [Candidatus Halobonum tyrrellensis G22]